MTNIKIIINFIQLIIFKIINIGIIKKNSKSKIRKIIKIIKKLLYIGKCLLLIWLNPHSILFIKFIFFFLKFILLMKLIIINIKIIRINVIFIILLLIKFYISF